MKINNNFKVFNSWCKRFSVSIVKFFLKMGKKFLSCFDGVRMNDLFGYFFFVVEIKMVLVIFLNF